MGFEGLCYEMGEADVLKYPMLTVQLEITLTWC